MSEEAREEIKLSGKMISVPIGKEGGIIMADSEFYKKLEILEKVTKTNLPKQFENVKDFAESAIHFANRCDLTLALKDTIFAEMSAARLRRDAEQRYTDGLITADEYFQIHHESLELIFDGLVEEVKKAIIPACECKKES